MVDINLLTGVFPTTQRPVDAKTYFITLAELIDLGASNHKAFYYYDRMRALCLENDITYVWREEATINEPNGLLVPGFTYPANTINNSIDYSGKTFNFFPLENESEPALPLIEDYGAIWIGGYDWSCWGDPYIIANAAYLASPIVLILNGPPTTQDYIRFDVIYGDINGNIGFITGQEGIQATPPDIDEGTQKLFQIVAWVYGQTDPLGITDIQVYNEFLGEPNEWTVSDNGGGTITLNSTNLPSKDITHIEGINVPNGKIISMIDDNYHPFLNFSGISFDLQTPTESAKITISLWSDGVRQTRELVIRPGRFTYIGIDPAYQSVVANGRRFISKTRFEFINGQIIRSPKLPFNEIRFTISSYEDTELSLFRLDNVRLVYGQNDNQEFSNTWLGLDDTDDISYQGKTGWSSTVNETETGLILKRLATLEDVYQGNAIIGQNGAGVEHIINFDFRIWGRAFIIDNVPYEGLQNYVEGLVTLSDAPLLNSRYDVFVINSDTKAIGSVQLTGGVSGSIDSISVNGVELLPAPVLYATTLADLAIETANAINSQVTLPNYYARAINGTIYIEAVEKGIIPNGFVVTVVTTNITTAKTDMSGGIDNVHSVGVLTGYAELNYVKPIPDPLTQVEVTNRITNSGEVSPPEVTTVQIYDENLGDPSEFNHVAQPAGSNHDYLTNPKSGTKSVFMPDTVGILQTYIWYSPTQNLPFVSGGNLYFWLLTQTSWPINKIRFGLQIANGATVSNTIFYNRISAQGIGFSSETPNVWQLCNVPISGFTFNGLTFNEIRFYVDNTPVLQLDDMYYQHGGGGPTAINITSVSVQNESQVEQFKMTDRILFEGVTFDPAAKKVIVNSPFIALDEGSGIGYVRKNSNRANYSNIGLGSFDLSQGGTGGHGVSGDYSIGFGDEIINSGDGSLVGGYQITSDASYSINIGYINVGGGFATAIFGAFQTDIGDNNGYNLLSGFRNYSWGFNGGYIGINLNSDQRRTIGTIFIGNSNEDIGQSYTNNQADQPMFVIGGGTSGLAYPYNLLTKKTLALFRRNGIFNFPYTTIAAIDGSIDTRIAITAEWALSKFITNTTGIGTGNVLNLNNVLGTLYNHQIVDTKNYTSYSINPGTIAGGRAMCRINAPSQPTVSGGNLEQGFPFIANRDMYLNVWSPDGTIIRYFFTPAEQIQSVNRQIQYTTNGNLTLASLHEGNLIMINLPTAARNCLVDNVLPENGEVEFLNVGSFNFTFMKGVLLDAVLNVPDGTILKPGSACTLIKKGTTNEYWLKGELE